MTLVQAMPGASVAKRVEEHGTKLWRLLHHPVDEARAKVDLARITRIGIEEAVHAFKADLTANQGDPDNIEEGCLDMPPSFIKGLKAQFPTPTSELMEMAAHPEVAEPGQGALRRIQLPGNS
jgi:hypothetical protein